MKQIYLLTAALATATLGLLAAGADKAPATTETAAPEAKADSAWLTNLDEAKKIAAKENKSILIDFTGSDWCGWCIKLKKEVFSHEEFTKEAGKHFVLVELDFPKESNQTDEEKATNKALAKEYKVEGFPTILITDETGKTYAKTGYREGGVEPYLKHLNKLRSRKGLE